MLCKNEDKNMNSQHPQQKLGIAAYGPIIIDLVDNRVTGFAGCQHSFRFNKRIRQGARTGHLRASSDVYICM